jgi:Subtilase family/GEVED domain/Secretion system C-terminal sorting domain
MPKLKFTLALLVLLCVTGNIFSQENTRADVMRIAARDQASKEQAIHERLLTLSKEKGWPLVIHGKKGQFAILAGVDVLGYPMYLGTDNNIAANTTRTNRLWPGGSTGLNLSGSSANLKGKLAVWDGGRIRNTHVELAGRVTQKDNPDPAFVDHSTHVAGTLIASGVNPLVKGMAFQLQELLAYDFNSHLSEMMNESPNLLVSNHSYGAISGWQYNDTESRWEFWGQANATQDYKFGYYSSEAQVWDSIAYNAPFYLIVKSVGNNRESNGPAVGQPYWRYNTNNQMVSSGNRPAGISDNNSYDCISTYGTSKNILTVGAIEPIIAGYQVPQDAKMTTFSSWGPTDDGRIKPDVVADGVDLLSSVASGDNDYAYSSGTSMCTPNAAGSLMLLQEQYSKLHAGAFMRSATLKGIVIHTADEAGISPGPDYQFGWGLINMEKAVSVITSTSDQLIQEKILNNGGTFSLPVIASGKGPITVTICWTDPKASVDNTNLLNNTARKLINDLDIRVKKGATTYSPWILTPANPAAAATTGDNVLDNVEKIEVPAAIPGESYTIEVTHKGTLERGSQAYSLIVSGVGGIAYCVSAATNTGGARIDSVSFGTIQKGSPAGCTTYTSYTNLTANIETNSSVPLFVKVSSCDATTANKIVKAFIDLNSDGDFTDAGEEVAVSPVINGNGTFSGNVAIPANAVIGNYSLLRIIVQETGTAASVVPCGNYANGETQDYRVRIIAPSNDIGVTEIVTPIAGDCSNGNQYVTVRIKNFGSASKTGIVLTGTVKNGATTVLPLTGTYPGTIEGYSEALYTFQTPFAAAAATTYTITVQSSLANDQKTTNDQSVASVAIAGVGAAPTGQAELCSPTQVTFKGAATSPDVAFWYDSPAATTPIASGNLASSNIITADKKYYVGLNDATLKLGPANKLAYPDGGYNVFKGNYVRFTVTAPFILETARLYIGGSPGKITFLVGKVASYDANNNPATYQAVTQVVLDVYPTKPTPPVPGEQNNDPADLGAIYYIGLPIPITGDVIITTTCDDGTSIFRNNLIATNPYPMNIPGVVSLIGNSAIDPNSLEQRKYYYFFYDMTLRLANCGTNRATVTAVTPVAPVITQSGNTLSSSSAVGNQWYRNGTSIAGATGPTYNANVSGTYKSIVTSVTGCQVASNDLAVTVTAIPNVDPTEIGLKTLPNPSNGRFNVEFTVQTRATMQLSIVNMLGQEVYKSTHPDFAGRFTKEMHLEKLPHGVYLLKVQHNRKNYIKKIFIQ